MLAQKQKSEGKLDLAQFIANRGSRVVDEAIFVSWELENAESTLQRSKMTRIEILYSKLEGECEPGCDGQWLQMAKEVSGTPLLGMTLQKVLAYFSTKGADSIATCA